MEFLDIRSMKNLEIHVPRPSPLLHVGYITNDNNIS
jgi:hypothetical protein